MLAEMRIGAEGKGEGKLVPAAKVSYDQDTRTIEIEDYGIEPVRLTQIRGHAGQEDHQPLIERGRAIRRGSSFPGGGGSLA